MSMIEQSTIGLGIEETAPKRLGASWSTVKAVGTAVFRSSATRDLACLLELDRSVKTWTCKPAALHYAGRVHDYDFRVAYHEGKDEIVDVDDRPIQVPLERITDGVADTGLTYRRISASEIENGYRLRNAKDLLAYSSFQPSLEDRMKLLAAFNEEAGMSLSRCLHVLGHRNALAAIASMVLGEYLDIDLDSAFIGLGTAIYTTRL
jgi:hypothetical protein